MNIIFRVDAALHIGSGHVMRCLTLADELKNRGATCVFICREFEGNLCALIKEKGYELFTLPADNIKLEFIKDQIVPHEHWLGVNYQDDAQQTITILNNLNIDIDWLIVDHYAIDIRWETLLRPYTKKVMLIDDLADRKHDCDLLLDQNLSANSSSYESITRSCCHFLLGTNYALMRDEFSLLRQKAIYKRANLLTLDNILIMLGGVDNSNITSYVVDALLPIVKHNSTVIIILGKSNPNRQILEKKLLKIGKSSFYLFQDVRNMAQFYFDADLCIGAGGSSSWERCVLGLPSINLILEKNQINICEQLDYFGAAINFGYLNEQTIPLLSDIISKFSEKGSEYQLMSQHAFSICDGKGAKRVVSKLLGES